ncbi:hypothetical protein ABZY05_50420 [Streptomyces canus]|uniref:hypothetical protein n=1 Tax=Streptomyces canus TaxID=58343 RepID=UPI0033AE8D22
MPSTAVRTTAAALLLTHATTYAADPGDPIALPVRDALAALPVQDEDRTGYERSKFRHWIDTDPDGCSTRVEVGPRDWWARMLRCRVFPDGYGLVSTVRQHLMQGQEFVLQAGGMIRGHGSTPVVGSVAVPMA